ncbi:MAG: DUF421 domain-containing protein [Actinobacteria bacterium]|nr:DUF421 domain-containing protein [Actinomycetota bacterium]
MAEARFVPGIPTWERAVRVVVVYAFLAIALRLAGKREQGQLTTFDLAVLLVLANTMQNAIIGPDNSLASGLIGAAVLLGLNALVVRLLYRFPRLDRWLEGAPTVLVRLGQPIARNLRRELINEAELRAAVHRHGLSDLNEVETAILEIDWSISVIGRHAAEASLRDAVARLERRLEAIAVALPPRPAPPGRRA